MEFYDKLTNYFEGTLSYSEEQSLFSELNLDEELREQFRRFVSLDKAFRKTATIYVAPSNVTSSIYSSLGFTIPSGIGGLASKSSGKTSFFKSVFFRTTLTAFSSAALALIAMWFFINTQNDSTISLKHQKAPIVKYESKQRKNFLEAKNVFMEKRIVLEPVQQTSIKKPAEIFTSIDQLPEQRNDTQDLLSSSKIEKQNLSDPVREDLPHLEVVPYVKELEADFISNEENSLFKDFSLEMKNSINWSIPKETIYPEEFSKLNNMGISILYDISDNFKIGGSLRQETFFVKYEHIENNKNFIYEQNPNLTSIGLLFNYRFDIFNAFNPYFGLNTDWSKYGYILRESAGISYLIIPSLSFFCEIQLNQLFFKHQGLYSNSNKFCVNYGFGIQL